MVLPVVIRSSLQDYQLSMFLRQTWHDPRLAYGELIPDGYTAADMILLEHPITEEIWIPDLIFTNEKDSHYHIVTTPNKYIRVYQNGTAFYSSRWVEEPEDEC